MKAHEEKSKTDREEKEAEVPPLTHPMWLTPLHMH